MPTPTGSKGKGKGKDKANERTPLLDEGESSASDDLPGGGQRQVGNEQTTAPLHLSARQAWRSYLLTAALAFLTLLLGFVIAILLLADSYAAPALHNVSKALSHSGRGGEKFWKEALLVRGPDAVSVTGVGRRPDDSGAMHLEVNITAAMRIVVDTDFLMGFREVDSDGDTWWREKWKVLGRWLVRRLGSTTADLGNVVIYPSSMNPPDPLITFKPVAPILIPLHPGLTAEDHRNPPSSIKSVPVSLRLQPSQNVSQVLEFLKQSWAQGFLSVGIFGSDLVIRGGSKYNNSPGWWELRQWRNWLKFDKEDFKLFITLPIPPFQIPSHPPSTPGSDLPELSELLVLESFNITSAPLPHLPPTPMPSSTAQLRNVGATTMVAIERDQTVLAAQTVTKLLAKEPSSFSSQGSSTGWSVLIFALASLAHPFATFAPDLDRLPPLPFIVSLPIPLAEDSAMKIDPIPVAEVYAYPKFNTTHIRIPLSGYVLPLSINSPRLPDAISAFVSSYLSYKPSAISIATPLYPSMEIHALFPPPSRRLELLRDVEIENMSIHPGMGGISVPNAWRETAESKVHPLEVLASATVHARVVLPRGVDIDVRVVRIWVDCLVFDGELPPDIYKEGGHILSNLPSRVLSSEVGDPPVPEPEPLPTPLPPRAFGRITPRTWLNATSTIAPSGTRGGPLSRMGVSDQDDTGTNVYVTAQIVDVPLEVLPGRQGDLSRFVTKVLFSRDPVMAGVRGVAAVGVSIPGLTNSVSGEPRVEGKELILTGLPFEGNVGVGGHDV